MTLLQYLAKIEQLVEDIEEDGGETDIEVRRLGSTGSRVEQPSGGPNPTIVYQEHILQIRNELFYFEGRGIIKKQFRYCFYQPGQRIDDPTVEPLIRLQSDANLNPRNAHFDPYISAHFPEHLWPTWIQDPDLVKAYELLKFIAIEKRLPTEFDHSRMDMIV